MEIIDDGRMKRGFKVLPSIDITSFDNGTYDVRIVGDTPIFYYAVDIIALVKYLSSLPAVYQALLPPEWSNALLVYRKLT